MNIWAKSVIKDGKLIKQEMSTTPTILVCENPSCYTPSKTDINNYYLKNNAQI